MGFPSLSLPNSRNCPDTCAPTSTNSSGSTVPVAVIVAVRFPFRTVPVRHNGRAERRACQTQALPAAPATATAIATIIKTFNNPFINFVLLGGAFAPPRTGFKFHAVAPLDGATGVQRSICSSGFIMPLPPFQSAAQTKSHTNLETNAPANKIFANS